MKTEKQRKRGLFGSDHDAGDDSKGGDWIRSPLCKALSLRYVTGCQSEPFITAPVPALIPRIPHARQKKKKRLVTHYQCGSGRFLWILRVCTGLYLGCVVRAGGKTGSGNKAGGQGVSLVSECSVLLSCVLSKDCLVSEH